MEAIEFSQYVSIALIIGTNSVAVGIGEGIACQAALDAINIQPAARTDISKTMILGTALMETSALLGLAMGVLLIIGTLGQTHTLGTALASWAIACALCLPGFFVGIFSGLPVKQACLAIARQPFFAPKILRFMLINQSITQTPAIFGFIIAILIKNQLPLATADLAQGLRLLGAGLSVGLGNIGPIIGLALFAQNACAALGINRTIYSKMLTFAFISQAIIETPGLFSLVISFLLVLAQADAGNVPAGLILLASGLCAGMGMIAIGISSGKTAGVTTEQMAFHSQHIAPLTRTSMFAQGIIDTAAIYVFLIAFGLFLIAQYL